MEMVGGYYQSHYGRYNIPYNMITIGEEFLEMLGIVVFIHALLSYLGSNDVKIRFDDKVPAPLELS